MSNRRKWALFIGLAGAGGLLSALASLAADLPAVAIPLGVVGAILAAVGGALTFQGGESPTEPMAGPKLVYGAIPQLARWFQDRPDEQNALTQGLAGNKRAALVALPGARGAGKSQLAAAHARKCADDGFDLVAWINAESGPVPELALLAKELGIPVEAGSPPEQAALAAIKAIGVNDGRRRLIVFDNVDDPDGLSRYLPASGTVKVIVTTNRQEFTTMAGVVPIEVGMFTPEQGVAFLNGATGLPGDEAARLVGQQLGWLPLGLSQAAAYIRLNNLSYGQYMTMLGTLPFDETLQRLAGAQHPGVLAAVRLSIEAIERADPSGNAKRLLGVLACLAPEGISRGLLTGEVGLEALELDEAAMTLALRVLAGSSLVTLAGPPDAVVVMVHRLTAAIVRQLGAEREAATRLIEALAATLPYAQVALRRKEFDELVAHVQALYEHTAPPTEGLLELCHWAACSLEEVGDSRRAIGLHEQTLADRERLLGPEHPSTLTSRHELAISHSRAGRNGVAIALFEQVLALRQDILGPDHRDTLIIRHDLAVGLRSVGRLEEAIALHEQTLADQERVLGPDDPITLLSRSNLAIDYEQAGRLDEAIALQRETLIDRERVLGPYHHDTLTSRSELANTYLVSHRVDEATALYRECLDGYERVLGLDHPITLLARRNLANAYRWAGQLDQAIGLYQRALADQERILGVDHYDTVLTRRELDQLRSKS